MDIMTAWASLMKPTILDEDTRAAMARAGWTTVRQSNVFQPCPRKLKFIIDEEHRYMSLYALLGSVFHLAWENRKTATLNSQAYWVRLFMECRAKDPNTTYVLDKVPINMSQIREAARVMADFLPEIIEHVAEELDRQGVQVLEHEHRVEYEDGITNKVTFQGTLDIRAERGGRRMTLDVKTTGMWDPVFAALRGRGSRQPKAVSFEMIQLQTHNQLRHYGWLEFISTGKWPEEVGIIVPTNASKYVRGPKKGQRKGPVLYYAPVLPFVPETYQEDLVALIRSTINGGFYRAMPSTYGKSDCPGCQFFTACIINPHAQTTSRTEYREAVSALYGNTKLTEIK
jgi:hypothetical protein